MTLIDIANFIRDYGWLGVTILLVAGGMLQLYVFRWQYREKVDEAKFWRDLYLSKDEKVDKALDTLQDALDMAKERERERERERQRRG